MTRPDARPWPTTAEALMRSRFEAFRDADAAWLMASWHPSTRPRILDLSGNPRWRGLQILDVSGGGEADETGIVEFRASYLTPDGVDFQYELVPVRPGGRALVLPGRRGRTGPGPLTAT